MQLDAADLQPALINMGSRRVIYFQQDNYTTSRPFFNMVYRISYSKTFHPSSLQRKLVALVGDVTQLFNASMSMFARE
jgi:hypothetical protein